MIRRALREPLLHFLFGGAILYLVYGMASGFNGDGRRIVIDKATVLSLIQYRAVLFQPELMSRQLAQLPHDELDKLVNDCVDDEVLYREAKSYQLERGDEVIRQRMIQKAEFLIDNDESAAPTERELRSYFDSHADRYVTQPSLTFAQVFVDSSKHGVSSEHVARDLVRALNRYRVGFSGATAYGDRFPFLVNYVDRPLDFVASEIGPEMTRSLTRLSPDSDRWQGPYQSPYGWHAVLLVKVGTKQPLKFEQVRDEVREAYLEEQRLQKREQALARLQKKYRVKVSIE